MTVELDGREWIELLAQDRSPSKERMVFRTRFRKTLRVRTSEWSLYFGGWDGLAIRPGDEIEVVAQAEGGPVLALPDWAVGQLEAVLRRTGVFDSTLLVLTADHGEPFGEHEYAWHTSCPYDEALHIPLLVRLPRSALPAARVEGR